MRRPHRLPCTCIACRLDAAKRRQAGLLPTHSDKRRKQKAEEARQRAAQLTLPIEAPK